MACPRLAFARRGRVILALEWIIPELTSMTAVNCSILIVLACFARIIHEFGRVRRKRCVRNDLRLSCLFHTARSNTSPTRK